jgi:hypothetical protein
MAYSPSAASALKALKSPNLPRTFAGRALTIDRKTKLTQKVAALAAARAAAVTAAANLTTATGYPATITALNAAIVLIDAAAST